MTEVEATEVVQQHIKWLAGFEGNRETIATALLWLCYYMGQHAGRASKSADALSVIIGICNTGNSDYLDTIKKIRTICEAHIDAP